MVPIGRHACAWIEKYLYIVRPLSIDEVDSQTLFLTKHGEGMQGKQLSVIVKKAIEAANLERFTDTHPNAACHLSRHALRRRCRRGDSCARAFSTACTC